MALLIGFFTIAGINFTIWLIVGIIRYFYEKVFPPPSIPRPATPIDLKDIAVIIPAHNEEKTIGKTIEALLKTFPPKNIYVASDFSSDRTVEIARSYFVRGLDIKPNRGKAKSLVHIMNEYFILDTYKFVIVNDADTEMHEDYLKNAIPFFDDPQVGAVATHGVTRWKNNFTILQNYFIAYRIRLWRVIQLGMRFGQTWKYTNVSFIVPGSLSFYRSSVLKQLDIDAPGLVIEDFNMTFEMHKKKLGKIGYNSKVIGVHQDPYNLHDYIKQVQRWNVGFFQTVKRHGIWPSLFFVCTSFYYIELLLYALFLGAVPALVTMFILQGFAPLNIPFFYEHLTFFDLLFGVFFMDYVLTIVAAYLEKRPLLLVYGLGFILLRYLDALIYMGSIIVAFTSKSSGVWKSPKRL